MVAAVLATAGVSAGQSAAPATRDAAPEALPNALPDAPAPVSVEDVSDQLRDLVDGVAYPSMAAVVVRGRDVIARGAVGVRKIGEETPITPFDKFHLGSCTKAMTATLCAMLIEEGKLRWDSTIGELFPELKESMKPGWDGITLEQLLTQTAGACKSLREHGLWGRLWNTDRSPAEARLDMLGTVVGWELDHVPGTKYAYSNTNYIIAGMMAERVTGEDFEELIMRRLFAPLGMTTAGFGAPGIADAVDQPLGTSREGVSIAPARNADNPPMLSPAGRAHMSLDDWAKFVSLHIEGERAPTARLLSAETYKKLHAPALNKYACGWSVPSRAWGGPRRVTLTHGGSNTLWYCVAWLAPDKGMAVLVATNTAREGVTKQCDQAAWRLIKRYIEPAQALTETDAAAPASR